MYLLIPPVPDIGAERIKNVHYNALLNLLKTLYLDEIKTTCETLKHKTPKITDIANNLQALCDELKVLAEQKQSESVQRL